MQQGGQRQKIGNERYEGRLVEWKGKFGWIQPISPINHAMAGRHGGKVYLSHTDVEADISGVGCSISFTAYADATGLGAMQVRPSDGGGVAHSIEKPSFQAPTFQKPMGFGNQMPKQMSHNAAPQQLHPGMQHPGQKQQQHVKQEPIELKTGTRARVFGMKESTEYNGQECKCEEWDALCGVWHVEIVKSGDFKGFKPENLLGLPDPKEDDFSQIANMVSFSANTMNKPAAVAAGPASFGFGKRERITEEPVTGEVVDWKQTFGWITPTDPIDHKDAKKRGGRIYLSKKDVTEGTVLEKGSTVQMHVYTDGNGLGAEEVMLF